MLKEENVASREVHGAGVGMLLPSCGELSHCCLKITTILNKLALFTTNLTSTVMCKSEFIGHKPQMELEQLLLLLSAQPADVCEVITLSAKYIWHFCNKW